MELVSILLPCYNHEKYIDDCMECLCNQTYQDIEIIVWDDNSTDQSFLKLKLWEQRLKERFVNVYISKNEYNLGVVKNINNMVRMARGKYIKVLATDDMLLPHAIESLVGYLEANEQEDIVFSNISYIGPNDTFSNIEVQKLPVRYRNTPVSGKNLTGILCGDNFIAAPGVMIPRRTFDRYGLFDENYIMEDFEYWLRVSIKGSFGYLNKVTTLYRKGDNSLSTFDLSESSKQRHRKFHEDKVAIFKNYQMYANTIQISSFYNSELNTAISLNDVHLSNELVSDMKKNRITISKKNMIKKCLLNMGLYIWFKRLKQRLS